MKQQWCIEKGYFIVDSEGRSIADVWGDDAKVKTNARLIAAAPDLLAACEALIKHGELDLATFDGDDILAGIQAAIAKAKGEAC